MADKLGLDNQTLDLKLGDSFKKQTPVAFHAIRYDFKPASVDTSKVSSVEVGENHSVTVSVPHVEGSGTSHTVYKGNKRPCQKECILIIDHNTGEITLEKLANTIQLKKTRSEMPSRLQSNRPITPVDVKSSSPKKKSSPTNSSGLTINSPLFSSSTVTNSSAKHDSSSNSSSSESDSSSSDDDEDKKPSNQSQPPPPRLPVTSQPPPQNGRPSYMSTLSEDLQLSDSGSDSD